mmetsp:Transcript_22706/g.27783  ORF Transcript_22706/g.27783 Transcript_22706/m.27783 type:complete len:214 (-) Transcript_22706:200-841(-)
MLFHCSRMATRRSRIFPTPNSVPSASGKNPVRSPPPTYPMFSPTCTTAIHCYSPQYQRVITVGPPHTYLHLLPLIPASIPQRCTGSKVYPHRFPRPCENSVRARDSDGSSSTSPAAIPRGNNAPSPHLVCVLHRNCVFRDRRSWTHPRTAYFDHHHLIYYCSGEESLFCKRGRNHGENHWCRSGASPIPDRAFRDERWWLGETRGWHWHQVVS